MGFGNYGYDWVIGSRKGGVETSYGDVIAAAEAEPGASIAWDSDDGESGAAVSARIDIGMKFGFSTR